MTDSHKRSGKRRRRKESSPLDRRRSPEESRRLKKQAQERARRRLAEDRPRRQDWDPEDSGGLTRMGGQRARTSETVSPSAATPSPTFEGRVCAPGRTQLRVLVAGRELSARIPPLLAQQDPGWPVVGDLLALRMEARDQLVVDQVLPRAGVLARGGGAGSSARVLAAHVDLGVLVLNAEASAFRPGLVDRGRLALVRGGIECLVVLNKIDQAGPELRAAHRAALADHLAAGLSLIETSAISGEGLRSLREQARGRCLVLFGHSGVGKSSLLNALDPEGQRKAARVRAGDGKGRHTTTAGGLTELADGTVLIDTPGVRAFGLGGVSKQELDELFPDIAELALNCRFHDCAHTTEPGCAVRRAREEGRLSAARWARRERLFGGGAKS